MGIARHGCNSRQAKVKGWDIISKFLHPGQDKTAQAAIDMHTDLILQCQIRKLFERIDNTMGIIAGRTGDGNSVLGDL